MCLLYWICGYQTYRSVDFSRHLDHRHPDKEDDCFPPLPDLGTITIKKEIKEEELCGVDDIFTEYNISGVKLEKIPDVITLDSDDSD